MAKRKPAASQTHRICNVLPSKNTQNDWNFGDAASSGMLGAVAALPASKDLRAAWWKVGDQGSTGSCVGWGSADGLMRYQMVRSGRLGQTVLLSPRFTWMASKETDEFTARPATFIEGAGTSLKAALDICRKYGVVRDSVLPFHLQTKMYMGDENAFFAAAATRKCAAYVNMFRNFTQWRTWLANNCPVLVALNVDSSFDRAAQTSGLIDNFQPATTRGGHCVCLVGYRADGRFIIRNSWGTAWGDQGFAYASEAYINAAFFNESYGISL